MIFGKIKSFSRSEQKNPTLQLVMRKYKTTQLKCCTTSLDQNEKPSAQTTPQIFPNYNNLVQKITNY
ncbi:unnamed protein product [Oikopleura dioica]|uniref:Uncharacterized protein n=1 Tax=Oikopleura dioica TaxID=34765 RepID=E4XTE8_OIKDI|nr:unnamed protein product [Oikopleura dioica]